MSKLMLGACVLLTSGLVAAGCGGDDDDALSKSEFLKQGNAICKKGDRAIDGAAKETFSSDQQPTDTQITKFAEDTAIPEIQTQIDDLGDLTPPSADEDTVNAILDEAQAGLDKAKDDPTIFASGNDPFEKANRLADDYGLTECAG